MNLYLGGPLPMPDIIADPPSPRCYSAVIPLFGPLLFPLFRPLFRDRESRNINRLILIVFSPARSESRPVRRRAERRTSAGG
jgi:hypothetical protein